MGYIESTTQNISFDTVSDNCYKAVTNANPLSSDIFCADPTAVEYDGRLYVYATNDHQQYMAVGDDGKNTYDKIQSIVIFSTEDMVNWTYHGLIDVASVAPWIMNSWAPSIVSRIEDDGLTHFYLYFSNNGCGVGVITATNPLGPWNDLLGEPLISTSTKGLTGCPNPFDPGVCIDDNGDGWLSFGGGKSSGGTEYMPGSARIVKLGKDMCSFDSEFIEIKAPYFFEASELNFINGTYVYTYNNSWDTRAQWDFDGIKRPTACSMAYMTTKTPLDSNSWEYRSDYFINSGEAGLDYSNNHSHIEKYKGKYYMLHHTMLRQSKMKTNGGFRSVSLVELTIDEDIVEIVPTKPTKEGVAQIANIKASKQNEAETVFTTAGIKYEADENSLVNAVTAAENGAWIMIKGVEFDNKTSGFFSAMVKGNGRIEVRLDSIENECVASAEFDSKDFKGVYSEGNKDVDGVHDVYIVLSDGISLDYWQFI